MHGFLAFSDLQGRIVNIIGTKTGKLECYLTGAYGEIFYDNSLKQSPQIIVCNTTDFRAEKSHVEANWYIWNALKYQFIHSNTRKTKRTYDYTGPNNFNEMTKAFNSLGVNGIDILDFCGTAK